MCVKSLPLSERVIQTTTTNWRFTAFTDWLPCTGIDTVKLALRCTGLQGALTFRPAMQFARILTSEPRTAFQYPAPDLSADGSYYRELDLSGTGTGDSGGNMWVRFGVMAKTSASNTGYAMIHMEVAFESVGEILGAIVDVPVDTEADNTTTQVFPLTGWVGTAGVEKYKAAFVVNVAAANSMEYGLCYRTAASDRDQPGSWTLLGSYTLADATNDEALVVDTAFGTELDDQMWVQLGVICRGGPSVNPGHGDLSAAVAVRGG